MTVYYIYGNDVFTKEEVLLFDTDSKDRAIEWAKKYCKSEEMGGWPMVYVCYENQVDIDWNGDPVAEKAVVWSCYQEPTDVGRVMDYPDNAYEEF